MGAHQSNIDTGSVLGGQVKKSVKQKAGAASTLETQSADKHCPICGCELVGGAGGYCRKCDDVKTSLCSSCNRYTPVNQKACVYCGANLRTDVWTNPQAYCVKCNKKVDMVNPKRMTGENGRPVLEGVCPTCRAKVLRTGEA